MVERTNDVYPRLCGYANDGNCSARYLNGNNDVTNGNANYGGSAQSEQI